MVVVRWIQQSAFNEFIGQVLGRRRAGVERDDDGAGRPARVRSASRRHRDRAGRHRRQARGARPSRRAVRPDGRRDGQQRHRRGAARRSGSGAAVLGAAWRVNLRLPDRAIGGDADHIRARRRLAGRGAPAARGRDSVRRRSPSRSRRREPGARPKASSTPGCAATTPADGEAWRPGWICYYFINDSAPPSFVVDVSAHYDTKRRALRCHVSQFKAAGDGAVQTRLTSPLFQQLVESRDAQFGALAGVAFAEGIVVDLMGAGSLTVETTLQRASENRTPNQEPERDPVNIGIICYASVGGSGIVATELAKALADRGHQVHLVSTDPPFRLGEYQAGPGVSPGAHAELSALPRTAVRAVAGEQGRAGRARVPARDHPRALRDPARDGGAAVEQVLESGGHGARGS